MVRGAWRLRASLKTLFREVPSSRVGHRQTVLVTGIVFLLTTFMTVQQIDLGAHPEQVGAFGLLPAARRDAGDALLAEHYDDQRGDARLGTAPWIASPVVEGPWLRVTVPIDPAADDPALHHGCLALAHPAPDAAAQRRAKLACLARLHPLQLDGKAVADPGYVIGSDAKARRPALVAMLDVRALHRAGTCCGWAAPPARTTPPAPT